MVGMGVGLNFDIIVGREGWGTRGWHSQWGLNVFGFFNHQTFNSLMDNLLFKGVSQEFSKSFLQEVRKKSLFSDLLGGENSRC